MLNENQRKLAWTKQYEAEIRSLYFADLAASNTTKKQWIVGLSFFLSSGAAASLIGQGPVWVAIVMSSFVAVLTAYSIAVNLDKSIVTMAKLHASWNSLAGEYAQLYEHWYEDDAEAALDNLRQRAYVLSETAATDTPYKPDLMSKWQDLVYSNIDAETGNKGLAASNEAATAPTPSATPSA